MLHVIPTLDPRYGGPVEGIHRITDALVHDGHRPAILCLDDPSAAWLSNIGTTPIFPVGEGILKFRYRPRLIREFRRIARDFDCVVVHGIWQYPGLLAWLSLRAGTIPYFVFPHGMLDPWFKEEYPLKHFKKLVYWAVAQRHILARAEAILYTCEEERRLARLSFPWYPDNDVTVGYGTALPADDAEVQKAAFADAFPHLANRRFLLSLSRIHPKKGHDILIEAFSAVSAEDPGLSLVIAGPDELGWQRSLEQLAAQRGISDRVFWVGMLQGNTKWGALRSAEAFILPSHQENFGIAVAEALACGIPVLISNKVNIWREILDSNAGIVTPDTIEGTIGALRAWAKLDSGERRQMKSRASECFARSFDVRSVARNLVSLMIARGVHGGSR